MVGEIDGVPSEDDVAHSTRGDSKEAVEHKQQKMTIAHQIKSLSVDVTLSHNRADHSIFERTQSYAHGYFCQ